MTGHWIPLTNQPHFSCGTMLLLTDGRVLCQDAGGPFSANGTGHWNTLTPDKHGSYINGTWNEVADGPNKPQFFASAVLNDGRVFVAGGEYNGSDAEAELLAAEIYDPVTNTWVSLPLPTESGLVPVWMSPSPLNGPAGGWNRGIDSFTAADVDGDGEVEIVIANNADDWTGVLKWQGGALVPVWMRPTLNVTFAMDAPACLLPNGRVLCAASPGPQCKYLGPTHFAEYDPDANVFLPVPDPPNNGNPVYYGRLLLLPTGEVLFSNSSTDLLGNGNIQVYRSDGHPRRDWKPVIYRRSLPHKITRGTTTTVTGIRFNGLSQAVSYGDDAQMATNYPLARLHHRKTGTVVYCRTANHSTMAVATGDAVVSTNFTVPATALPGPSNLVLVANGIPSRPVRVVIN
jgi:hypothetical protein